MEKTMEAAAKIRLLENREEVLTSRDKENQEVCRKIRRNIRNLKKKQESGNLL